MASRTQGGSETGEWKRRDASLSTRRSTAKTHTWPTSAPRDTHPTSKEESAPRELKAGKSGEHKCSPLTPRCHISHRRRLLNSPTHPHTQNTLNLPIPPLFYGQQGSPESWGKPRASQKEIKRDRLTLKGTDNLGGGKKDLKHQNTKPYNYSKPEPRRFS